MCSKKSEKSFEPGRDYILTNKEDNRGKGNQQGIPKYFSYLD